MTDPAHPGSQGAHARRAALPVDRAGADHHRRLPGPRGRQCGAQARPLPRRGDAPARHPHRPGRAHRRQPHHRCSRRRGLPGGRHQLDRPRARHDVDAAPGQVQRPPRGRRHLPRADPAVLAGQDPRGHPPGRGRPPPRRHHPRGQDQPEGPRPGPHLPRHREVDPPGSGRHPRRGGRAGRVRDARPARVLRLRAHRPRCVDGLHAPVCGPRDGHGRHGRDPRARRQPPRGRPDLQQAERRRRRDVPRGGPVPLVPVHAAAHGEQRLVVLAGPRGPVPLPLLPRGRRRRPAGPGGCPRAHRGALAQVQPDRLPAELAQRVVLRGLPDRLQRRLRRPGPGGPGRVERPLVPLPRGPGPHPPAAAQPVRPPPREHAGHAPRRVHPGDRHGLRHAPGVQRRVHHPRPRGAGHRAGRRRQLRDRRLRRAHHPRQQPRVVRRGDVQPGQGARARHERWQVPPHGRAARSADRLPHGLRDLRGPRAARSPSRSTTSSRR